MTVTEFQRARTPQQQQLRRAVILDAAREMIEQNPLADISLRELSRRVGLAKSNVVRYFPSREAVFLALMVEDWSGWLDELEARLPRPDRRRHPHTTHALIAAEIAASLAERPVFCDLIASAQTILEHNIPLATAREFKRAGYAHTARLATLVQHSRPQLPDGRAFEFAGVTWALVAGGWPAANPSPIVAQVLAEPELADMCIDFVPALTSVLTAVLDGMTRPLSRREPAG